MNKFGALTVSGYLASAHYILIIYFLASHSTNDLLIYMIYATGLLSILLLSIAPQTFNSFPLANLFILAITTFYAGTMLSFAIVTRWLPAVMEQLGGAIAVRDKDCDAKAVVTVSSVYILLLFFLNLLNI